jgi:hypothetical protein
MERALNQGIFLKAGTKFRKQQSNSPYVYMKNVPIYYNNNVQLLDFSDLLPDLAYRFKDVL